VNIRRLSNLNLSLPLFLEVFPGSRMLIPNQLDTFLSECISVGKREVVSLSTCVCREESECNLVNSANGKTRVKAEEYTFTKTTNVLI
jgi:hypothetical protein